MRVDSMTEGGLDISFEKTRGAEMDSTAATPPTLFALREWGIKCVLLFVCIIMHQSHGESSSLRPHCSDGCDGGDSLLLFFILLREVLCPCSEQRSSLPFGRQHPSTALLVRAALASGSRSQRQRVHTLGVDLAQSEPPHTTHHLLVTRV